MRHWEKAVEILVLILIAIGGACVAVAVANHSRAWGIAGGVVFGTAIWIWFVCFVLHPLTLKASNWRAGLQTSRSLNTAISQQLAKRQHGSLEILSATYGPIDKIYDVTDRLAERVNDQGLDIIVGNWLSGVDPDLNVLKRLIVRYGTDQGAESIIRDENDRLVLP